LLRTGCFEAKDRKARDQGQGLEDTFENSRKYKNVDIVIMISQTFKRKIV